MAGEQDFLDPMFYENLRLELECDKQFPNQQPVWTNCGMAGVIDFDRIPKNVTNLQICLPDGTNVGFLHARRKL